jgi:hypothetical protein
MTDQNGFFRFVWRVNGLLLLLFLLVLSGLLAFTQWKEWKSRQERDRYVVAAVKAQQSATKFTLQAASSAGPFGGPTALHILEEDKAPYMQYPHPDQIIMHNVLSVNEKAGTSHWLFPKGHQIILAQQMVYNFGTGKEGEESSLASRELGFAMVLVEADSNKDGEVDERDRQSLYFYRLDEKSPEKLLSADVIRLQTPNWQLPLLQLIYQEAGKSYAVTYALPEGTLKSKIAISDLPPLSEPRSTIVPKVGFITEPAVVE